VEHTGARPGESGGFSPYPWALAASQAFQKHLSTLLFLAYDFDQLAGGAALAIDPKAPGAAFFLTSSTADYCDIISTPANRRGVILALLEEIQKLGLHDLVLENVPANSAILQELPGVAGSRRFYVTSRSACTCGGVQLGSEGQPCYARSGEGDASDGTGRDRGRPGIDRLRADCRLSRKQPGQPIGWPRAPRLPAKLSDRCLNLAGSRSASWKSMAGR